MTQISFQFFTRRREDAKMGVLHAFAPSRLRVNPLSRHPRDGGGPSPEPSVYTKAPVLDSRLRGNDEVCDRGGKLIKGRTYFVPSCLRASQL